MYYVLFTYSKGHKERDFRGFRSQEDVIDFLHKNHEKIDIVQIIAAEKSFRLGLIETEELIKSELIAQDIETDLPDPEEESSAASKIIEGINQHEREEKEREKSEEKSAMEKIGDDVEKEMTEEEIIKKNKIALKKADNVIAKAKKDLEKKSERLIINPVEKPEKKTQMGRIIDKTDWKKCPECNRRKIAPWNESGRCSHCQQYKKKSKKK